MIRLIIRETYENGPDTVGHKYRTLLVDVPALDEMRRDTYSDFEIVGGEFMDEPKREASR